ncbi:polysaccharide biosynthesis tyrosine autokinase [Streptosporangium subroseum]|uniref:polysaccharide biosynthesis tyrosine autokinase n=1 Tax=Streptosporangium subroseum TaxID=106412 RepID=UPI00342A1A3F
MNTRDLIAGVRRNLLLVILLAVLGTGSGLGIGLLQAEEYKTTTTLFVSIAQGSQSSIDQRYQGTLFTQERVRSYAALVTTPTVTKPVIKALQLPLKPEELAQRLEVDVPVDTVLLNITARYGDGGTVAKIANAVTARLVEVVAELESPDRTQLSGIRVKVVRDAAVPEQPSSPRIILDIVLGLVLGLVGGVGAGILREALDTRIHTAADLVRFSKQPVLAIVPKDPGAQATPLVGDRFGPRAEAYRKLRTALRFVGIDRPAKVFMITSPLTGDGKSTTAVNLAGALAAEGAQVVLVEVDLRRPALAQMLGLVGEAGLTSVLTGRADLADVAQFTTGTQRITVLTSGPLPPDPSELLGTQRMRDLLQRLAQGFDYVILDAPPLLPVTDAAVLVPEVDGTILVTRAKKTRRDELHEALTILETARGRVVGAVFNCGTAPTADRYGPYVRDTAPPQRNAPQPQVRDIPQSLRSTDQNRASLAGKRGPRRSDLPVNEDRVVPPARD